MDYFNINLNKGLKSQMRQKLVLLKRLGILKKAAVLCSSLMIKMKNGIWNFELWGIISGAAVPSTSVSLKASFSSSNCEITWKKYILFNYLEIKFIITKCNYDLWLLKQISRMYFPLSFTITFCKINYNP